MTRYIRVGQIINTHGHKGELKIYPLTDNIERFYDLQRVFINREENYIPYTICSVRKHNNIVLLFLDEVPDMNTAEKLQGLYLEIPENELEPLPEGQYYIYQLIGMPVYENERYLGILKDIIRTGSNDVYIVEDSARPKPLLIPALKSVVSKIDFENGKIFVKLLPGLED